MKDCSERRDGARRRSERGGARLNFLIVAAIICVAGYVGYQLIPVLYRAEAFETFMQDTVNNAVYSDKNAAYVKQQIEKSLPEYEVPTDAVIRVEVRNAHLEAEVQYTQLVPLVVTQYRYHFDKTVRSSTVVGGSGG